MARYAIIRDADNIVRNVVEWDGGTDWAPPRDHTALLLTTGRPSSGDTWVSGQTFTTPAPPALTRRQQLMALSTFTNPQRDEALSILLRDER